MDTSSTASPALPASWNPTGPQELTLLSLLAPTLGDHPDPKTIKSVLQIAEDEGVESEALYEAALVMRLPQWSPAPPYPVVEPARKRPRLASALKLSPELQAEQGGAGAKDPSSSPPSPTPNEQMPSPPGLPLGSS